MIIVWLFAALFLGPIALVGASELVGLGIRMLRRSRSGDGDDGLPRARLLQR